MDLLELIEALKTTRFQNGDMQCYIKVPTPNGLEIYDIAKASLHSLPDGTPFVTFNIGDLKFIAGERKPENDTGNTDVSEEPSS